MMGLFSHRSATRCAVAMAVFASATFPAKIQIDVPVVTQEQTEWCWVGVSASILRYYSQTVTQCQIANFARTTATWHDFGKEDCCAKGAGACNYWNYNYGREGSIEEILKKWGVGSVGQAGTLTLAQIATQLEAKRPFIIRWALVPSGGHFIVGHGVSDSSIHYMDPWPGEGSKIAKYSWIVSNKDKNWEGTNILTSSPTASVHHAGASLQSSMVARMTENGLTISYSLDAPSAVRIGVRSLQGKAVRTLEIPAGRQGAYSQNMSGISFAPGGYVLSLQAGASSATTLLFVER